MSQRNVTIAIILAAIGFLVSSALFTVQETELAMKFRLGEIVKADYEPGLHWKIPFINNVKTFDKRILTLDATPAKYLTKEKKNVLVDFFVKWRITDVKAFYKSISNGSIVTANNRLYSIINDDLRGEFSNRTIQEVISGERREIMQKTTEITNEKVKGLGIQVVDVRIKRIDYEQSISDSVFRRMMAERQRVAKEFRALGAEEAEKISANADRQRTVILADAYRASQELRGEGDAKAADIYAKAYSKDAEFYAFFRSLEAYKQSFKDQGSVLVLEPNSEFFNYFKNTKPKR